MAARKVLSLNYHPWMTGAITLGDEVAQRIDDAPGLHDKLEELLTWFTSVAIGCSTGTPEEAASKLDELHRVVDEFYKKLMLRKLGTTALKATDAT